MENEVTKRSVDIEKWLTRSMLPRTLMQGTHGMQQAGEKFLPKHTAESDDAFEARLNASTLLNAYRKTCSFLAGQVFQVDVKFAEGVDPVFLEWSQSIDAGGNSLSVFAKRVFQNGLGKGVSHILVDVPEKNPDVITQADEAAAGIRPFFKEIRAEDILGGIVDETGFLVQLRISETLTRRVGRFGTKKVDLVRVLEPGKWELYEVNDEGEEVLTSEGAFTVPYIPIVPFIPGEEWSLLTGETPLMDLAELNKKHWRSSSEQDNILSIARAPFILGIGITLDMLTVGTSTMVATDDTDADMKYVEHSGAAIGAGAADLEKTEAQMGLYGLQQLIPRQGSQTATEKAISSSESSSSLGTWATEFESVLNRAFEIAGDFMKKPFPDHAISLNKEFSYGVADSAELAQLIALYEKNVLSAQGAFAEFKRRGAIVESYTWEENQEQKELDVYQDTNFEGLAGATFGATGENI